MLKLDTIIISSDVFSYNYDNSFAEDSFSPVMEEFHKTEREGLYELLLRLKEHNRIIILIKPGVESEKLDKRVRGWEILEFSGTKQKSGNFDLKGISAQGKEFDWRSVLFIETDYYFALDCLRDKIQTIIFVDIYRLVREMKLRKMKGLKST